MQEVDVKRMEVGLLTVAPNQSMKMAPFQSLVTVPAATNKSTSPPPNRPDPFEFSSE